jgi:hypothetical protein
MDLIRLKTRTLNLDYLILVEPVDGSDGRSRVVMEAGLERELDREDSECLLARLAERERPGGPAGREDITHQVTVRKGRGASGGHPKRASG